MITYCFIQFCFRGTFQINAIKNTLSIHLNKYKQAENYICAILTVIDCLYYEEEHMQEVRQHLTVISLTP